MAMKDHMNSGRCRSWVVVCWEEEENDYWLL